MIYSKAALQVVHLCGKDDSIPYLDNVWFDKTGAICAAGRNLLMVVGEVPDNILAEVPLQKKAKNFDFNINNDNDNDNDNQNLSGFSVSSNSVKKILAAIPQDTTFGGRLEFVDVSIDVEEKDVNFTLHDGKAKSTITVKGRFDGKWVPWGEILVNTEKARAMVRDHGRVLLNRYRLKNLLDIFDKVAPDKGGEYPVYMEFCGEGSIILRSVNYKTGQKVLAVMSTWKSGEWMQYGDFENKLFGIKKSNKRRRI